MAKFYENTPTRIVIVSIFYIGAFGVALLQLNTIAFKYISSGYLYIVAAEHFMISLLFGYFWAQISGITGRREIGSVLILPTIYFVVLLGYDYLIKFSDDGYFVLVIILAVGQYTGVLIGSVISRWRRAIA